MLRTSLLVLAGLITTGLLLSLATVLKQGLPLLEPPGLWTRLGVYLGTNVAVTAPDAQFRELASVYAQTDPDHILESLQEAGERLGWTQIHSDSRARRIQAVVTSSGFGFIDDLEVRLKPVSPGSWRLDIRAAARLGHADFGANERHILDLLAMLRRTGLVLRSTP